MPNPDHITEETVRKFFWTEGDLEYKLDPLQTHISHTVRANFHTSKKICVLSSRQIGKSFWVMVFALEFLIRFPKSIVRVIAPTREKCEEIVEDNLNVIISDVPQGVIARSSTKNRWNLFNGSSLRLGALERQYVDKNRGGNAKLIIYEECGFVSGDDFLYGINSVIGPQLLRSKGHEIFVTSPSEQPDHPLHTRIAPACELKGTLFNYMVFNSPTIDDRAIVEAAERTGTEFDVDFVRRARARVNGPEKMLAAELVLMAQAEGITLTDDFMREFMAMIIRVKTLMVIPVFHERETVVEFNVPAVCRWQVAIDWGGVRDKTVAILMAYEYNSDTDLIWDEKKWDENTPTNEIVEGLREWDDIIGDSPRWADVPGQLQIDLEHEYGYTVHLPPKANFIAAVNNMAARFARKRVKIRKRCKFIIASVRAGMLNKTRTDFERTKELGHMDALAALMYGIRCQDRSSPYDSRQHSVTVDQFVNPDVVKEQNAQFNDQVKVFGDGPKRFGRYRK